LVPLLAFVKVQSFLLSYSNNEIWTFWGKGCVDEDNDTGLLCVYGRYVYSGRVVVHVDNVLGLFVLADKYNIVDLKSSCVQLMRRHLVIQRGDKCHAVAWYQCSLACSDSELHHACFSYVVLNMDVVMSSAQWICLDLDNLVAILCRSDLIVHDEYSILEV